MKKRGSYAFFVDDNIVVDRNYSLRLFRGMRGQENLSLMNSRKQWMATLF